MINRSLYIKLLFLPLYCVALQALSQQSSLYEIKRMSFNTNGFSEISPVIVKDGIVFCSNRRFSALKDRTTFEGKRLYNIYLAERKDSAVWKKVIEIKSERSTLFNIGPFCIAQDGKTVYFTSEVETGKVTKKRNYKNHSGIFIADISGTDLINLRPFKYNNSQFEVAHPSVSTDGRYLFFASDMPGGKGGADLYYSESVNGEWSLPVNLGSAVNSSGTENYPYIHPSGKLYFTSDRPGGIGQMDVYSTSLNYGTWEKPVLLPEPINSSADDFAFVAGGNLQDGYFSSNRQKDDDIYMFSTTIIRKVSCDSLIENNYCFRFTEENAVKFDTMPFRYEWKFGDGEKGIGPVVEHCYIGAGTYLVQLDVVNLITKEVLYNEKTDTLVVSDIEQPYITGPDRVAAGKEIILNADSTNLPGWNIVQYYWNFGDESSSIGKEVRKTYLKSGTYNIQLIVSTEPEPGGMVREACVSKNIIVTR